MSIDLVSATIANINARTGNAYNTTLNSDAGRQQVADYLQHLYRTGDELYTDDFEGRTPMGLGNWEVSRRFFENPNQVLTQEQRNAMFLNSVALGVGNDPSRLNNLSNVFMYAAAGAVMAHYPDLQTGGRNPHSGESGRVQLSQQHMNPDCSVNQYAVKRDFPGLYLSWGEFQAAINP
jgi:hypothetical protein